MGAEPLCWIDEEFLQSIKNKDRLGVARYKRHYQLEMKPELVKQCTVSGLEGMHILPRSKRSTDNKRKCCKVCLKSLNRTRGKRNGAVVCDNEYCTDLAHKLLDFTS